MNCSIDCWICSGLGGWERSGIPLPGRFIPERREDRSVGGVDELLLLLLPSLSDPPRGIEDNTVDFVRKLRLILLRLAEQLSVATHDRSCTRFAKKIK